MPLDPTRSVSIPTTVSRLRRLVVTVAPALLMALVPVALTACSGSGGAVYASPQVGVDALIEAIDPYDAAKVSTVLGPKGPEVLESGDAVIDQHHMQRFVAAYRAKHSLVPDGDDAMTLLVGEQEWPMPIQLVKSEKGWQFDTAFGAEEIVARRIGRNELDAIQVCLAVVDAQREYAAGGYGGAPGVYAARLLSEPGTKNGLYWKTGEGEPPSPMGPMVTQAAAEGYTAPEPGSTAKRAYHGYRYRLLTSQGKFAPGGAKDYLVDGRLVGGFAVLAYPAEYGNSGIMSFMVSHQGVVFERDLGPNTERKAEAIRTFDPTPEWLLVP